MFLALQSHHHLYDLAWQDWLTVVGFPLTLVGLYMTWRQARNASSSAEAARRAVHRTEQQIRANQLMVLIPQLMWTASEIDTAIEMENFPLVRRYLNNWRRQAGNVHGMLLAADPDETEIARDLNNSVSMAAIAETLLLRAQKSTRADCMKARQAIIAAADKLNVWVGRNSTETSDQGGSE